MKEVNHQNFGIKLFSEYVADPSAASFAEPEELQTALEKFPYCQLLHLFYSRSLAAKGFLENADHLAKTTIIIPDRTILYSVLRDPEKLNTTDSKLRASIESQVSMESPENEADQYAEEIIEESQTENLLDKTREQTVPISLEPEIKAEDSETDQKVSKYDDDKMPYSFLWWLNKTRNEHSDTYQPYVEFKLDTTQTIKRTSVDQLSSQIIENIFHLQSPLEEVENAPKTVPFQVRRKEDSILDKFIKEEPQIKPPNSQKLDTENKARKSAEDPNDLVSETLAQIYTDQMLFQKAIDTFKKLSLKFPEKSTYFADQIIELEKKVN